MLLPLIENYEPLSFDKLMRDFQDVFTGLGCLPGEYHIEIDPDIRPVQHTPRRVPVPLKAKLKVHLTPNFFFR